MCMVVTLFASAACARLRGRQEHQPHKLGLGRILRENNGAQSRAISHELDSLLGSWVSQRTLTQEARDRRDLRLLAGQIAAVDKQLVVERKELAFAQAISHGRSQRELRLKQQVQHLLNVRREFLAQQATLRASMQASGAGSVMT